MPTFPFTTFLDETRPFWVLEDGVGPLVPFTTFLDEAKPFGVLADKLGNLIFINFYQYSISIKIF